MLKTATCEATLARIDRDDGVVPRVEAPLIRCLVLLMDDDHMMDDGDDLSDHSEDERLLRADVDDVSDGDDDGVPPAKRARVDAVAATWMRRAALPTTPSPLTNMMSGKAGGVWYGYQCRFVDLGKSYEMKMG